MGGSCGTSSSTAVSVGDNTITLTQTDNSSALAAGTYSDCTVTVTDAAINASTPLSITNFTVDTAAPSVTSVSVLADATYGVAENLDFTVNFDEAVTVTGTPQIAITIGSTISARRNSSPAAARRLCCSATPSRRAIMTPTASRSAR